MILDITPREGKMLAIALGTAHAVDHVPHESAVRAAMSLAEKWQKEEFTCKEIHACLDKFAIAGEEALPLGHTKPNLN